MHWAYRILRAALFGTAVGLALVWLMARQGVLQSDGSQWRLGAGGVAVLLLAWVVLRRRFARGRNSRDKA